MWSPASTSTCSGRCARMMSMFWYSASAVPRYQSGPRALLRRDDLDELAELAAQVTPAALDVLDQRVRLVLREHRDLADAGVDAVRQREVDDAELAAERRRRLAAILGQVPEALAAAAGHDHGQRAPGQAAEVTTGGERFLLVGQHVAVRSDRRRCSDVTEWRTDPILAQCRYGHAKHHQIPARLSAGGLFGPLIHPVSYSIDCILLLDVYYGSVNAMSRSQ